MFGDGFMAAIRGQKHVDLGKRALARLVKDGEHFEVIVDPVLAWRYRRGDESVDIRDVLEGWVVFKNALKGERAGEEVLVKAFGIDDDLKVADIIIREGELQLTVEQRRKMVEAKRKQIVAWISRNCIDPGTGTPHPPTRIERAMNEASVSIDPFIDVEEQGVDVVKALMPIIPIRLERMLVEMTFPPQFSGKAYGVVSKYGVIKKDKWLSNGAWNVQVELPAGLKAEMSDEISKMTRGKVEVKVVERME